MRFLNFWFCAILFFGDPSFTAHAQTPVTQGRAVVLVRQLPEVQKYLKKVPAAHIEIDHESDSKEAWVVHVFEIKEGHTATFNWFDVDKNTGKIKKEFP